MNKILKLLAHADDETLLMSRFDCHVQGLHSIVLRNYNGRLTRCFLADVNHKMYNNGTHDPDMALGVHDHLYPLTLEHVSGYPVNINYKAGSCRGAVLYDSYKHWNGRLATVGLTALSIRSFNDMMNGCKLALTADQLHTVYVPRWVKASWLVYEGEKVHQVTNMYTLNSAPLCTYTPATSADQVREFVNKFFEVKNG